MGCVQTRRSSPISGLNRMKAENGYVPGGPGLRSTSTRLSGKLRATRGHHMEKADAHDDTGGGDDAEREGRASLRASKGSAKEEIVDGWPRWLVDNVPREALLGLHRKSAESYDKIFKIGQGTYSNVYKARDRDTGKIVALKKVRFDTSESESVKFMAREIMILRKLDHPNVIKLEGLATSRMQYSLYLVFDFMQSDLAKVISGLEGRLTEPQVKCYMQQLLAGLQHCHERGILHRDIKGSNLLIDKTGILKIADFGLANYFNPNQKCHLTSRVVTLWYRAPELLLGATDYGAGIDLWSAGCLFGEMFTGRPIMPGRTEVEQLHKIFKLCGSPSEDYWKKMKLATSFRPQPYKPSLSETFRDLPSSSWGLMTRLLALDPANRGSASSALQSDFFTTSPLACDLSGLPVVYKGDDDENIASNEKRRNRYSKAKRSRANREGQRKKSLAIEKPKGDSGSSKEGKEKSSAASQSSSNAGSTSSSLKPTRHDASSPLFSPVVSNLLKTASARIEGQPWSTKNVKTMPPILPTSKSSTANIEDGDQVYRFSLVGRSSTSDFHKLVDTTRMPKKFALDN